VQRYADEAQQEPMAREAISRLPLSNLPRKV
jgi:hypothetical protein